MNKVEIYNTEEDGKLVVGVRVNDTGATVQDLLDAWQPLCDDTSVLKKYAPDKSSVCRGCLVNCCNTAYVIPDLIALKKMAAWFNHDYHQLLDKYFDKTKLNIGLLRMKPNPCIFLENNICTIYPVRTLICRFYLCTETLGTTQELIYSVTWAGIAAAQLFAVQHDLIQRNPNAARSSFDLLLERLIAEYQDGEKIIPFLEAREYSDIPLKIFI